MFQFFRRKDTAVRVFLGGLLVLVCVMMVVTLIPGLTGSGPSNEMVVAKVGGESITSAELARQIGLLTRNNRLPSSMIPVYAPQILNQLVTEKVMLLEAGRMGLSVSTQELAGELRRNAQFFPGGQYIGEDQYRSFVESRFGMSVPEFEDRMRESMLMEKLRRMVTAGAAVTDQDVAREFHRRNDKIRIEFAVLKTADVKNTLQLFRGRTRRFLPEEPDPLPSSRAAEIQAGLPRHGQAERANAGFRTGPAALLQRQQGPLPG